MLGEHGQVTAQVGVLDLVGFLEPLHVLQDLPLHPADPLVVPVEAQEGETQGGQDQDSDGQEAFQLALATLFQLFIGGDDAGL